MRKDGRPSNGHTTRQPIANQQGVLNMAVRVVVVKLRNRMYLMDLMSWKYCFELRSGCRVPAICGLDEAWQPVADAQRHHQTLASEQSGSDALAGLQTRALPVLEMTIFRVMPEAPESGESLRDNVNESAPKAPLLVFE